jgi:D-alanine transaminase
VPENTLYLNGEFMPLEQGLISVEDRGFQFGDGVYEVIKVLNGRPLWVQEHLRRLERSLEAILMAGALAGHDLHNVVERLPRMASLSEGMIYVQVTRGVGARDFLYTAELDPTVIAYTRRCPYPSELQILAGIGLHPVEDFRWARCDIKAVDLLPGVLAKRSAWEAGCAEALWIGYGEAREGGSSNFFAVVSGVLRTHPLGNRILDGITRQIVLRLAREVGVPVAERAVTEDELARAEEAFVTSTISDVMPVVSIGGRPVGPGRPGVVTLGLADSLRAEIARLAGLPAPPSLISFHA